MDIDENIYRINLQSAITASNLIYDLSAFLDKEEVHNKKIFLQMSDIDLNVAQLKSIRSLINSVNSSLSFISTNSEMTKSSAMALEIVISDENTTTPAQIEPEKTYKTLDEVIENNKSEGQDENNTVVIETSEFTHKEAQDALESLLDETETTQDKTTETVEEDIKGEEEPIETENDDDSIEEEIDPLDSIFESEKKFEDIMPVTDELQNTGLDVEYYKNLDNEFTQEDLEIENLPTMYIKHTLRSGQVISYEGNVVIIGDCHTGSEVHATGDITIWGILSGIAHAGSAGNIRAKIRALKMNAIQLRIADSYARKPDVLNTILTEKTNEFTPEEARYIDGDIVIFKIND